MPSDQKFKKYWMKISKLKLEETQILERMSAEVNRPPEWSDRLVGLFQGGWGSAVKGQLRGLH
jgi:hypothetical protein